MSDYYDEAMLAGYYDYKVLSESLSKEINDDSDVLEIGVGTGLMLEELFKIKPNCNYTGIDHTDSMLEEAKKRLPHSIKLIEKDVLDMNLDTKFNVIFSHGGVWGFAEKMFGSHILNKESNKEGLKNIHKHLKSQGKFLISIQSSHENSDVILKNNIIFRQTVKEVDDILYKEYIFERNGELLSKQYGTYQLWKGDEIDKLFRSSGFIDAGVTEDNKFRIYKLA
jgi:ubiquinone/menaquinone biosynthesis C-methylase UbiE